MRAQLALGSTSLLSRNIVVPRTTGPPGAAKKLHLAMMLCTKGESSVSPYLG